MDNTLKFYLLAEKGGWDTSAYAFKYRSTYTQSKAYQILSFNTIEAKKHLSITAEEIVSEYENLKIEPRTLSEAFILESRLNYLALHSFPEYYLNPLAIDPSYQGEITTLGSLIIETQKKDMSFNDLILNEEIPLEEKKEIADSKVSQYLDEMNQIVNTSIRMVQRRAFSRDNIDKDKKTLIFDVFSIFLIFSADLLFFFSLILPNIQFWQEIYNFSSTRFLSYLVYLYPLSLFLYNLFFVIFHSYKTKISEPFNFARRFLRRKSQKVYDDIKVTAERLYDYLCGAINNRILLQNDIRDFSKLSSSYVDFNKVLNVSALKKRKTYRVLHSLNNIFATISWVVTIVTLLVYIFTNVLQGAM